MGRVVLSMSVSVDGYMSGPEGELDWHLVDDELHQHFNDELSAVSWFVDGRVTWQLMADFWPTADEVPGASGPMREFARIWRDKPKIVFSRTLEQAGWGTQIRREVDPAEARALADGSDGDVALGGADLAATWFRLGLVDEVRLYVHPVVLGAGVPLFQPGAQPLRFRSRATRTFGNGVVGLAYDVVR